MLKSELTEILSRTPETEREIAIHQMHLQGNINAIRHALQAEFQQRPNCNDPRFSAYEKRMAELDMQMDAAVVEYQEFCQKHQIRPTKH